MQSGRYGELGKSSYLSSIFNASQSAAIQRATDTQDPEQRTGIIGRIQGTLAEYMVDHKTAEIPNTAFEKIVENAISAAKRNPSLGTLA